MYATKPTVPVTSGPSKLTKQDAAFLQYQNTLYYEQAVLTTENKRHRNDKTHFKAYYYLFSS